MNSLNHYAYGSVCEAVYSRIMGLRCAAPGWKRAIIHPHIDGRLEHAQIEYDSPAGRWAVRWKIEEDGGASLHVRVPEGAAATVILPDHPDDFTQEIGPGEYDYGWTPTRDYLHPFSVQSLAMDVMANGDARAVIKRNAPGVYGMLCEPDCEFMPMPLIAIAHAQPFLDPAVILALDGDLRAVSIR